MTPEIYEKLIKRVIKESLNGINGTVFAYGPTGSGKTFTMMGQKSSLASVEDMSQGKRSLARLERLLHEEIDLAQAFKSNFEQGDGLIMMGIRDIFRQINLDSERKFSLSCSYLEIYNDNIYDLLHPLERLEEELQITEINVRPPHPERVLHQGRDRDARAEHLRRRRVSQEGRDESPLRQDTAQPPKLPLAHHLPHEGQVARQERRRPDRLRKRSGSLG